jgi:SAM-dependent methyltransferase
MDARDWDRRWQGKALHAHGEPSSLVVDTLAELQPGLALDLACGSGRHAVWLAGRGWRVTAVDFSGEALRQARELAAEEGADVDWVEADLLAYEPPAESFDLVLIAYLHVPAGQRRRVLAKGAAAVAPGGAFLLVGHDLANIGTGAPGPTNPALLYTPADIVPELSGLEVQRSESVTRAVTLEDGTRPEAVDALVLAAKA